jgi:hypothetical protein
MTEGNEHKPQDKTSEETPLPQSSYKVIEPDQNSAYDQFAKENRLLLSQVHAVAEEEVKAPAPKPPRVPWSERVRKFRENPVKVYCAAGLGLGILLAILLAILFSFLGPPNGRYDLGPVSSDANGLKGRLYLQWEKKLQYRLTLEPGDPDQQAGFALAVTGSKEPLSVRINLLDVKGFALCGKDILLQYSAPNGQAAPGAGQQNEAAREQGRDLFQNQIAADGRITAINAQGDLSCSAKDYEQAEGWSFTTNFPALAAQQKILKEQKGIQANAGRPSAQELAARKKAAAKNASKPVLAFSVEGDDAIVDFDAYHGTITTRGRKTFFIDKATAALANSRWQDYPMAIHFRCNRNAECTLMSGGAGAMHAKLAR